MQHSYSLRWFFSELVYCLTGCVFVQIETAYDTFLMQSMRQRMSGDMQINPNIKYADVPTRQTIRQVRSTDVFSCPQVPEPHLHSCT